MTTPITKERLEELANFRGAPVSRREEQTLARIALAAMNAKPVAYMWDSDRKDVDAAGYYRPEHKIFAESSVKRYGGKVVPLYAAPPAPVSVPDEVIVLLNHLEDVLPDDAFNLIDVKTWNNVSMLSRPDVYRAAMLQAGNSPVVPDGWQLVPVEPTENMLDAAYSFPASTEDRMRKQYVAMLAAAPQQEVES
ncbi:hypothetical protein OFY05_00785 [Pseudocitrobacter faecalis]|nr:hypothetical protein OFY05_00785 [Pseudocitrobacter faecalis]